MSSLSSVSAVFTAATETVKVYRTRVETNIHPNSPSPVGKCFIGLRFDSILLNSMIVLLFNFPPSKHVEMMSSPTRPPCPSELSGPDLSPFLPSMLRCGCTLGPTDSFGGSVEETESSAPGGPAGDLLGGETLQPLLF